MPDREKRLLESIVKRATELRLNTRNPVEDLSTPPETSDDEALAAIRNTFGEADTNQDDLTDG